jgi:hypothetical protein
MSQTEYLTYAETTVTWQVYSTLYGLGFIFSIIALTFQVIGFLNRKIDRFLNWMFPYKHVPRENSFEPDYRQDYRQYRRSTVCVGGFFHGGHGM